MSPILLDGVKYILWVPETEDELQDIVKEHSKEIFWEGSLFFDVKKKIISKSGRGSKPDGYLIDFSDDEWWVIEVELSSHPIDEHIVSQLSKFIRATKNSLTRKEIIDTLYSDIKNDPIKCAFVKKRMGSEEKDMHKLLSKVISKDPEGIIVIVEKLQPEIEEACESLKTQTYFIELKTFVKKGARMKLHAHLITLSWEEERFDHAIYDEGRKIFSCNCGDEAHRNSSTFKLGEINEHLLLAHRIPYEEQIIDGWTEDLEKQFKRYLAKKYQKTRK